LIRLTYSIVALGTGFCDGIIWDVDSFAEGTIDATYALLSSIAILSQTGIWLPKCETVSYLVISYGLGFAFLSFSGSGTG
jgi:hypothetical protein